MQVPYIKSETNYTKVPDLSKFFAHTHDVYELYFFISGDGKYFVEGTIYPMKPGDLLIMRKGETHALIINSLQPYERIVINFNAEAIFKEVREGLCAFLDNRPLGKNNKYNHTILMNTNIDYYLNKICNCEDIYKKRLYLTALLSELNEIDNTEKVEKTVKDNFSEILVFINENLSKPLSLENICARFYISRAQLNRKFKKMTGQTAWEYISTKRLIMAKELLKKGETPTKVYRKVGYNEYCSFYRAYKAKFLVSPKDEVK